MFADTGAAALLADTAHPPVLANAAAATVLADAAHPAVLAEAAAAALLAPAALSPVFAQATAAALLADAAPPPVLALLVSHSHVRTAGLTRRDARLYWKLPPPRGVFCSCVFASIYGVIS